MIGRLNHVAIAVPNLEKARELYQHVLGAKVSEPLAQPTHGVTVAFVELPNSNLELLEVLGDKSPVADFLEKHPAGGMHHMCFDVSDIIAERDQLKAKGMHILGSGEPTIGAHGKPVLFLHPKDLLGCLVELQQV